VDRGSHFVTTPVAGGPVDREQKTQIGRALQQLGIELIAKDFQLQGIKEIKPKKIF